MAMTRGFRITARQIGYPYFCLERLVYPVQPNGAYGSWPDYPVCTEDEFDKPGGVNWWDGARSALTAARHLLEESRCLTTRVYATPTS